MPRLFMRALAFSVCAGALCSVSLPAAAQTGPSAVLRLVSQPPSNGPRQPLALTFSATNTSEGPVANLSVELIISLPARNRTAYELSLHSDATGTLFAISFPQAGTLQPGQTRMFSIRQKLDMLTARNESIIYPLSIVLRSQDVQIGILRTPLIFLSEHPKVPLNLAWTWTLWEPLQYGPDGTFEQGPIEADIAPGGRLDAMVASLERLDRARADVVVSSVLLDELQRMAGGYRALDASGAREVPKGTSGAANAARLLAALQKIAARPGVELAVMPFGDPSVPALVGAGLTRDLRPLTERGNALARAALHASPAPEVARPSFSQLDAGSLAALARLGVRTVLLDPGFVPTAPGLQYSPPPVARFSVGNRTVTGLIPDTGVASVASAYASDPQLDAHAALGELAAIWQEKPGTPGRGAAVLFPERGSLPPEFFRAFASAVAGSSWLRTVRASELEGIVGTGVHQPLAVQAYPGFALDYVRSLLDAKDRLAAFRATGEGAKPLAAALGDLLLLSESSIFVTNSTAGTRFIQAPMRRIRAVYNHVGVANAKVPLTLVSRSGVLPITLYNDSGFPMRVVLRFVTDRRLVFVDGDSQEIILPASSHTLTIPVRAQTTGRFPIKIQLLTPTPATGSAPDTIAETELIVRSTAYNLVALVVTIGAALFLAIWWGRRFLPRQRH
jgi:hypothetical protein